MNIFKPVVFWLALFALLFGKDNNMSDFAKPELAIFFGFLQIQKMKKADHLQGEPFVHIPSEEEILKMFSKEAASKRFTVDEAFDLNFDDED